RNKSDIGVTLQPSSLQRTLSTPHYSDFASLDLKPITKPPELCFFEFISIKWKKMNNPLLEITLNRKDVFGGVDQ
ncbi:MAG: hypothetical protein QNJ02_14785, partial [Desulfobacterales bacterium]|nr:hypothetical protein [Desulfobacterales bacterium]